MSHGTTHSYSVATFAVKNHFKLWQVLQREKLQHELFSDWLWKTGTLTLTTKASQQMSTSTSALQTTYRRWKRNWQRGFWQLTKDGLKLTSDRWQTQHESCSQYQEPGFTDQSLLTDQTGNTIDRQALFTTYWDLLFTKK